MFLREFIGGSDIMRSANGVIRLIQIPGKKEALNNNRVMREMLTSEFLSSGSDSRNLVIVIWVVGPKSDIAVLKKPSSELQKSDIRVTSPGVLLNKVLYREAPTGGPTPYPSHLWRERYPFRIPFIVKWCPIHIPTNSTSLCHFM